ncbi:hypothetical protein LINGRAHAP2_LOCUS21924 [Linum grandiflorum]
MGVLPHNQPWSFQGALQQGQSFLHGRSLLSASGHEDPSWPELRCQVLHSSFHRFAFLRELSCLRSRFLGFCS